MQGQPWDSVFVGHNINLAQAEKERQRLLLERFQEEVTTRCLTLCLALQADLSQLKYTSWCAASWI
jgi:hypothetical protein